VDALTIVLFVVGIVLLVLGAEVLIRGASRLALTVGISPLVVGLTVVAFGTSAPEMAVSATAAASGETDIAIGNVVGSNLFNTLVILGFCGLVGSLVIHWRIIRLEVPMVIVLSVALWAMIRDGALDRWEAGLLFAGLLGYTAWSIRASRRETAAAQAELAPGAELPEGPGRWYVDVGLVVVGLVMLVVGSNWMVDGASEMAEALGVSQLVIGLTVVAAGTSLPELATSLLATWRGQRDIAVGNVIGSNIFNLLGVLGLGGLVADGGLVASELVQNVDVVVMIGAAALCLPVFLSGEHRLHRSESALFVTAYGLYLAYLIMRSSDAGAPDWFVNLARFGFVPLAGIVVVWIAIRDVAAGKAGPQQARPTAP
jgi:cation:H+ antiporter